MIHLTTGSLRLIVLEEGEIPTQQHNHVAITFRDREPGFIKGYLASEITEDIVHSMFPLPVNDDRNPLSELLKEIDLTLKQSGYPGLQIGNKPDVALVRNRAEEVLSCDELLNIYEGLQKAQAAYDLKIPQSRILIELI